MACLAGNAPAGFSKEQADANRDGIITVADIIAIINIIRNNK